MDRDRAGDARAQHERTGIHERIICEPDGEAPADEHASELSEEVPACVHASDSGDDARTRERAFVPISTDDAPRSTVSVDVECCPICLHDFTDRALLATCLHAFCFDCVRRWLRVCRACPLCKRHSTSIVHRIESERIYERYWLPDDDEAVVGGVEQDEELAAPRGYRRRRGAASLDRVRGSGRRPVSSSTATAPWGRRYGRRGDGNVTNDDDEQHAVDHENEQALRRRRDVYRRNLWAKHVGSNIQSRYVEVSPAHFSASPAHLDRLRPWIRRELMAILNDHDVELVLRFVEGILVRVPLQSERTVEALRPFLFEHVEHFIHELVSFARSPFEMRTYDMAVQYAVMDESERVAAISSGSSRQAASNASQSHDDRPSRRADLGSPK